MALSYMNKSKKIDNNNNKAKVCYITAYEINYEKIREEFPSLKVDCFIKKPIKIQDLVRRINTELEEVKNDS